TVSRAADPDGIAAGAAALSGDAARARRKIPTRGPRVEWAFSHRTRLMDASKIDRYVGAKWDDEIVPQLVEYIRIPNKSPMFDADWVKNGYMADAVKLMESWARAQSI